MAAADNPYFIAPANAMQALMSGYQGYDTAKKSRIEDEQRQAMDDAAAAFGKNDLTGMSQALFRGGQIGPALNVAQMMRQKEASDALIGPLEKLFMPGGGAPGGAPSPGAAIPSGAPPAGVEPPPAVAASTGGGSALGGIPGMGVNPQIVSYPGMPQPAPAPAPAPGAGVPPQPQARSAAPPPPAGAPSPQVSPSINGQPLSLAIPSLLRGALDSNQSKATQETMRALLVKAMDQYPEEIKKLEIFRQRPDLLQVATQLAEATSGRGLAMSDRGQANEIFKTRLAADKVSYEKAAEGATAARKAIPVLSEMIRLNDKVPGGWLSQASPGYAKFAASVGISVPEGVSNAELFAAMSRQLIPAIRDPGSTSNAEQQMYMQVTPNAMQSQDGRLKIASMLKAQAVRQTEIADVTREYMGKPELSQKLQELDNKPMFSPEDRKWLESQLQTPPGTAKGESNKTSTGVTWGIP